MAFWGVEVRPSKPYAHNFDQSLGRLRISQATMGDGKSTFKSTVQCNVGNKSPVLLCSLIPNVSETCHLELEFEEDEEVIFSVIGQRSIHLTGYYLAHRPSLDGDDSESYGEDIAKSDSSDSYSNGSEDEYESDFIDDADVAIFKDSQRPKSSVVIEEIEDDDKQHRNFRRLRKKNEISDSEDFETESKQQLMVRNKESSKEESEDEDGFPIIFTVENKSSKKKKINDDKKRKADAISQDTTSVSDCDSAPVMSADPDSFKQKKKSKKRRVKEEGVADEKDSFKDDKNGTDKVLEEDEMPVDNDCDSAPVMSADLDSFKQKKKSKKRRVKEEGLADEKDSFKDNKNGTDKVLKEDEMPVDNIASTATTDISVVKKKKKKNKKKNGDSDIKHEALEKEKAGLVNGVDESQHGSQAIKTRTFPNGLIVEEVSMGKPDGKKASPGKKVSVRYIGKLKNGTIFDSNIGQRPFKFRLGIGEVIKGWDIGVSGMCVGDKRRLTIPPSFGYGAKGVGKIPPNSWLVFDVELVDVQ